MTRRGRSVLALGLVVYLAAWAFGSRPLYPVAAGLLLAFALAWAWVRAADRPMQVERRSPTRDHVEGDDVEQRVIVRPTSRLPPPTAALVETVGRLGEQRHVLRRQGRRLFVDYELCRLPRGRYAFADSRIEIADPFGLQRRAISLPRPGALLVYPRIVNLDRLFSESGAHALEGRRLLLRRPTGFDLHSVRDYEHGESLRKVHWRSTARRGQLMVKELEDAPRDEIAVLLDAQRGSAAGESFDVQVRVAASVLDAYVRRNRRAVLVLNAVERTAPVTTLLADEASPAARALELVVVTAQIEASLVARLVQRALARRRVSLVYVDAPTFAGASPAVEPRLLRLSGAGVPIAVVRAGDDLAAVLSGDTGAEAAHA